MKKPADAKYLTLSQIGKGSYASVHKAINRQTGEICAIKKIPVDKHTEINNFINEIGILSECNCKNIVRYLDSSCSGTEVSIVMEYCCGGSVKDVMRQLNRTMTQEQITVILKDVLNGLDYLHSKNKIHRDVKAANILLDGEGIAKLGDFGVSEPLDTSVKGRSVIGTLLWVPPEVINQDPDYKPVIDIWSLGITIIEMAEGQPPYKNLDLSAALKEIGNLNKPPPTFTDTTIWSQTLVDFLSLCLVKDASRRKCAHELLTHELFKDSPSNDALKALVDEVCPGTVSTESGPIPYHKSECLLKESAILLSIYKALCMKVIRVDQMTDSLSSVEKDFDEIQKVLALRDSEVNEIKAQSKTLENELNELMKQKEGLESTLKSLKERKHEILDQLDKIREKQQKRFGSVELKWTQELRSLEGKSD